MKHSDSDFDRCLNPESQAAYLRESEPVINIYVVLLLAAWFGFGLLWVLSGKRNQDSSSQPAPIEQRINHPQPNV